MHRSKRVAEFIIYETLIKSGHEYTWLWIAIEAVNKTILDIHISKERNMLIAEQFIKSLVKKYGKWNISIDGGTWYPQACKFLRPTGIQPEELDMEVHIENRSAKFIVTYHYLVCFMIIYSPI